MNVLKQPSNTTAIKLLILDVDGVLTDGKIYLHPDGSESKVFHAHDGLGIRNLQKHGIAVAIISGRSSPIVDRRMQELGIEHVYQGAQDKQRHFAELLKIYHITAHETAYIGDDVPDLAVMEQVGLAITVANATDPIKAIAHWQTERKGGKGAVREACDEIIKHY